MNVHLKDLSSDITGAHLHLGAPGVNDRHVDLGNLVDGNRIRGTVDLTVADIEALVFGSVYVNVHTDTNQDGEIRGQLIVQKVFL